jgi:hypothetical protein
MNKLNSKWSAAIAGVALSFSIFSANSAKAVTVTFSQGGWQYGGELSGSFTGDDLNGDDIIEASELSDFIATFSGNLSIAGAINPSTGEPIIGFFNVSQSLPSLEPPNVLATLNFSYSSSTSQLSFSSLRVTCSVRNPPFVECAQPGSESQISVSSAGGFILFDPSVRLGFTRFTTSSSSTPTVDGDKLSGCPGNF